MYSDDLERRLSLAQAEIACIRILSDEHDFSGNLQRVVEIGLKATHVSRVYVFENEDDPVLGVCMRQVCEACADGVESQIDNPEFQHLPYTVSAPLLLSHLVAREPYVRVTSELDGPERAILEAQHILSILIEPVFVGDTLWGFIGFDDCESPRDWRSEDIRILEAVADAIGMAVSRRQQKRENDRRVVFQQLISVTCSRLAQADAGAMDDALSRSLEEIGRFSEADRAYLFQFRNGNARMNKTHEWCAEGVEPQIQNMQDIMLDEELPQFAKQIKNGDAIYIPRVSDLPSEMEQERRLFAQQGIQSLIGVPMKTSGRLIGFLGFDAVKIRKEWSEDDRLLLQFVADSMAGALQRIHTEERLRESEQRHRILLEEALNPVFQVDEEGIYIDANDAALHFMECDREDLVGKRVWDFTPPEAMERQQIEHAPFVGKRTLETTYLIHGRIKTLLLNVVPLEFGGMTVLCGIGQEITERKQSQELLRQSEDKYRSLFNQSTEGIYLHDLEGHILDVNEMACEQSGYSREEWLGLTVFDGHPSKSTTNLEKAQILQAWRQWAPGQRFIVEADLQRKDGAIYPVEISTGIVRYGDSNAVLAIVKDITERKRMEEEIKKIKWMLTSKPPASPGLTPENDIEDQGYGDLTALNRDGLISRSIDKDTLKDISTEYLNLLETSSAIYEKNGDYAYGIFCSAWCRLMDDASRKLCHTEDNAVALASGKWLCHESCWTDCSKRAIESQSPVDIECSGGMHLYAVPIFSAGEVIGAINFGYGDPPNDAAKLRSLAESYALDPKILALNADEFPSRPAYVIELAKQRLLSSARLIGILVERKRAEDALRASEGKFRSIFSSMTEIVVLHELVCDEDNRPVNYRIIDCNPAFTRITGIRRENAVGRLATDVYGSDRAPYLDEYARVALAGEPCNFITAYAPIDKYLEVHVASPGMNMFVTVTTDITERKRYEDELRRARELSERIIEDGPVAITLLDRDGTINFANRLAQRLFGLTNPNLEVRSYNAPEWLITDVDGSHFPEERLPFRQIMSTGQAVYDVQHAITMPDASRKILSINGAPLHDAQGQIDQVVFSIQDITERKRLEEERLEMERKIQHTQKLESLGVLAGGIAHDFNNLLMSILGHADLALDELTPTSPARANIQQIEMASRRAADLCAQMLAYSGKGRFIIESFDVSAIIEEMTHLLKTSISKKAVLNLQIEKNLPKVEGDVTQIRQVIMNLVINASEAIGEGIGVIRVATGTCQCQTADFQNAYFEGEPAEGRYVHIEVTDTGCGMDQATLDRLFEPFFTTKFTGRGLGMSAVLGIVRGHKGILKVTSEKGKGATFEIFLPPSTDCDTSEPKEASPPTHLGAKKARILLVDDELCIRVLGQKMLERIGFQAITAADGQEALAVYEREGETIDLVVLDLTMPHMDGEETLHGLKRLNPDVRIVMASGYSNHEIETRFAGKGLLSIIQKPYTMEQLKERLYPLFDN